MKDELITLFTAAGMIEAEILRSMLEAHGIPVMLSRESAMSAYSVGVGPFAEVELKVRQDHQPQAEALLEDYFAGRLDIPDAESNE